MAKLVLVQTLIVEKRKSEKIKTDEIKESIDYLVQSNMDKDVIDNTVKLLKEFKENKEGLEKMKEHIRRYFKGW